MNGKQCTIGLLKHLTLHIRKGYTMTTNSSVPRETLEEMWTSEKLINQDAINNMDKETLEKVLAILNKIK